MIFDFQKYKSKSSGWCKLAPIFCDKFQHNHALHWLQLSQYLPILQRNHQPAWPLEMGVEIFVLCVFSVFYSEFLCLFVCYSWFKVFVSVSRSVCLCLCLYLQDILFLQWWPTSDNKPRLLWDQGVGGSERWGRHLDFTLAGSVIRIRIIVVIMIIITNFIMNHGHHNHDLPAGHNHHHHHHHQSSSSCFTWQTHQPAS